MTGKMKSFLLGLIAGLAGKPLEFPKGEPTETAENGEDEEKE